MTNFQGNLFEFPNEERPESQDPEISSSNEKHTKQTSDLENDPEHPETLVKSQEIVTRPNSEVMATKKDVTQIHDGDSTTSENYESNCIIATARNIKDRNDDSSPRSVRTANSALDSEGSEPTLVKIDLVERYDNTEQNALININPTSQNLGITPTNRYVQLTQDLGDKPHKCDTCMYRSSIQNWKPISGVIHCPKCQFEETPLFRAQSRKSGASSCYCWLCFIPYLFPTRSQNLLHCAECFNFLGLYDERTKSIWPNKEYIDFDGCFPEGETKRKRRRQGIIIREEYC